MRLAVFGPAFFRGKKYQNYEYVARCIEEIEGITGIVSGGGEGVEKLALRYAALSGLEKDVIPPNIRLHGVDNAFIFRNQEIIKAADFTLLLWDGKDAKYHRLMSDVVDHEKRLLLLHVE